MMTAPGRPSQCGRRAPGHCARGFTLIEVLVALAILAVALAAAVRAVSIAADGTLELKERLLATWVAQDRLASYATQPTWPDVGTRQGSAKEANMDFAWRETVSGTPNPRLRRVEVQVFSPRAPTHAVATMIGFAAQNQ